MEDLLESALKYKEKLKSAVDKEEEKLIEDSLKLKEMRNRVLTNIPKKKAKHKNKSPAVKNLSMVHPGHENFNLVFNIMLGIKKATEAVIDFPMFELQKKDFKIK
jgi:hypothetical protein